MVLSVHLSEPMATILVALVTFVLVIATLHVSWQTRNAARAGHRPYLGDMPVGEYLGRYNIIYGNGEADVSLNDRGAMHIDAVLGANGWVVEQRSVGVRNVGTGAALVVNVELELLDHPVEPAEPPRTRSVPFVIPAGEAARLVTSVNYGSADLDRHRMLAREQVNFRIAAEYTDVADKQRQRTTIRTRSRTFHGTVIEQDPVVTVRSVSRAELRRREERVSWGQVDMPGIWGAADSR
jgi:hypothetical protein